MAKIELRLSSKIQAETGMTEILCRQIFGRKAEFRAKTGIFINPSFFEYYINRAKTESLGIKVPTNLNTCTMSDAEKKGYQVFNRGEFVIRKRIMTEDVKYHLAMRETLDNLLKYSLDAWNDADPNETNGDWLQITFDKFHHPERYQEKQDFTFFELMEDFKNNSKRKVNGKREGEKSQVWKNNFDVLIRALKRYEAFLQLSENKEFHLDLNTMNKDTISDIESFLRNEYQLLEDYPGIYERIPNFTDTRKSPKPTKRGNNTIAALFNKFKAFVSWSIEKGFTTNDPFNGFEGISGEKYGTPVYITLEERNHIADFDLSDCSHLAIQRDIFIFQCLIGCRVSDLMRMTKENIINGFLEYIPSKTKGERLNVVRVPLNDRAKAILKRYQDTDNKTLLPFISAQKYNDAIKKIFQVCGITRKVTILDSVSGKEIQRPINEVASSHLARRTFVGNLYKKVSDPNLIGSMSGHAPGSKAFVRYRAIDDDLKKEVVNLID